MAEDMQQIRHVWPSRTGILFEVAEQEPVVVDLEIQGRRVWSFRQDEARAPSPLPEDVLPDGVRPDELRPEALRFQPWPRALVPRLCGRFRVGLRPVGPGDAGVAEATVSLDGGSEPLALVDLHGRPLVVNKWGRLGHAIADAEPAMVERMLDHMDDIRMLLEKQLGPVVMVTGGTLLGPYREGRILPHDDDADLAYLSGRSAPVDVALEAFEVGRVLSAAGYDVVRLSVGHVQMHFSHEGVPDHYVDVFTGFVLDGRWYQHFALRTEAGRDDVLPVGTVTVHGRDEPAPRRPELLLEATFGPGWSTPDPSFTFDLPSSVGDRFYGWFGDYNVEREDWDDEIRLAPSDPATGPVQLSAFGRWVAERTPPGHALLDLGCGAGSDALALGDAGRTVRGVDFSRDAVRAARARAADRGPGISFELLNLLDTRQVIRLGAQLASCPHTWSVYGRRLLNALEDRGRDNVFRLCSMLLRDGGTASFDVVADHGYPGIAPHRHLGVPQVVAEAADRGLVLEEAEPRLELLRWFGESDEQIVEMHRMTFRRRSR